MNEYIYIINYNQKKYCLTQDFNAVSPKVASFKF